MQAERQTVPHAGGERGGTAGKTARDQRNRREVHLDFAESVAGNSAEETERGGLVRAGEGAAVGQRYAGLPQGPAGGERMSVTL